MQDFKTLGQLLLKIKNLGGGERGGHTRLLIREPSLYSQVRVIVMFVKPGFQIKCNMKKINLFRPISIIIFFDKLNFPELEEPYQTQLSSDINKIITSEKHCRHLPRET